MRRLCLLAVLSLHTNLISNIEDDLCSRRYFISLRACATKDRNRTARTAISTSALSGEPFQARGRGVWPGPIQIKAPFHIVGVHDVSRVTTDHNDRIILTFPHRIVEGNQVAIWGKIITKKVATKMAIINTDVPL